MKGIIAPFVEGFVDSCRLAMSILRGAGKSLRLLWLHIDSFAHHQDSGEKRRRAIH